MRAKGKGVEKKKKKKKSDVFISFFALLGGSRRWIFKGFTFSCTASSLESV